MFIVFGATGHVGSPVTKALLHDGYAVTAVIRNPAHAKDLRALGAAIAVADVYDVEALHDILCTDKRLFLLNRPAAPNGSMDETGKDTVRHLLAAIDGSGLEKIVAESTYVAQAGEEIGDLNTLFVMEEGLRSQPIPQSIIRAAYYFSNWDQMLGPAQHDGILPTMYPADMKLPMIAPDDLGVFAARLFSEPVDQTGIHYVEVPQRYSSRDVADAFADALGRSVEPYVTPRVNWEEAYRELGFSKAAARSYARMTAKKADGDYDMPDDPVRGSATRQSYIKALVDGS